MAEIILSVNPAELLKKSGEFNAQRTQMLRILETAKTNIASLKGVWTGTAADEFQTKFKAMYATCDAILNEMKKHEAVLKEAAQVYTASEAAAKAQVEKLPTSGVFR